MADTMTKCPACGYPIMAHYEGETALCANCGQKVEMAVSNGIVTVPTPLFAGLIGFGLGMLFGPALLSSTRGGARWLDKQAKQRIG